MDSLPSLHNSKEEINQIVIIKVNKSFNINYTFFYWYISRLLRLYIFVVCIIIFILLYIYKVKSLCCVFSGNILFKVP